jgi:hypothetical protein
MMVVLGLISSKIPQFEERDLLLRRIDEAAKYVPLDHHPTGAAACFFRSGAATRWGRCRPEWSWVDRE